MSIDRGMDKEYIYNGILLSHKKNEIMPFAATRMQLEIIILSEVSQKEKDKHHLISLVRGYYLNMESKIGHKWELPGQASG